jgi:hypothetical protein
VRPAQGRDQAGIEIPQELRSPFVLQCLKQAYPLPSFPAVSLLTTDGAERRRSISGENRKKERKKKRKERKGKTNRG